MMHPKNNILDRNPIENLLKNPKIPTYLIICFFSIYFLNSLDIYAIRLGQGVLLFLGFTGYYYTFSNRKSRNNIIFVSVLVILTVIGLISYSINKNADIIEYLWPVAYGGAAIILLNFKIKVNPVAGVYYIMCLIYLSAMIQNRVPEDLTGGTSRNTISIIVLAVLVLFLIILFRNKKYVTPLPSYIGLVIMLWALGRSGIFTLLFLSIGLSVYSLRLKKIEKKTVYWLIAGCLLIILILFVFKEWLIYPVLRNFSHYGMKSPRSVIWLNYLSDIFKSPIYLLFGYPLIGNPVNTTFHYNLHNSFLNLHSRYGLIGFTFFTYKIIQKIVELIEEKNVIYLIIIITIVFRITFDLAAFNGVLDVFIYYFIFEKMYRTENRRYKLID